MNISCIIKLKIGEPRKPISRNGNDTPANIFFLYFLMFRQGIGRTIFSFGPLRYTYLQLALYFITKRVLGKDSRFNDFCSIERTTIALFLRIHFTARFGFIPHFEIIIKTQHNTHSMKCRYRALLNCALTPRPFAR